MRLQSQIDLPLTSITTRILWLEIGDKVNRITHTRIDPQNRQKLAFLMKRDTLVPPPTPLLHSICIDTKGPGKQSKRYRANFSARRTTVWRNPAHVGLWRCVHCAKNSAGVNKAGYPSVGTRRRSMIKANARCLTVVSAITEYWHRKFGHVRYVWFGESLQKQSKFIAKSSSRGLGSQQWSH